MGRVWKSSNPYRSEEEVRWTTTAFDAVGRVTFVTSPDTSVVSTVYSGNRVLVTDQALKQRLSETDALGHLKDIWEVRTADAATESISFPGHAEVVAGYNTTYEYDSLDNLTKVTQGTQMQRTFAYDSLKRLTSASNPENGTVSYQYDNNGNLLVKKDAREVFIHFSYDALNRPIRRWYNGSSSPSASGNNVPALPTGVSASHEINYSYDAPGETNNGRGRLSSVTSSVSSYSYSGYDALGRVLGGTQATDGQSYTMSYSYDLAGNIKSQSYPSGRVVASEYELAGRLAGVKNQANGLYYAGAAATDSTNRLQYTAHGTPSQMRLGNGLWEHTNFNTRLQPTQIGLGTSSTNSSVLQLDYSYGATANNGNVLSHTITVPTIGAVAGFTATQAYTYDALNRLATAQENSGASWTQNFSYDRYGNRSFAGGTSSPSPLNVSNNPVFNPNDNRIDIAAVGQTLYSYDGAGNLTHDAAGHAFGYDAENKLTTYEGGTSNGGATYLYDGDGRRVKKVVGGPTIVTTVFVYNVAGQLVAEYSTAAPPAPGGTSYMTSDTLGSPRVITVANQGVKARHDYLPFGEEIGGPQIALLGGRATAQGYTGDTVRQKFTSKERDNDTGLDYFGARYYASNQGRFTSVDPSRKSIITANPQTWNRYSYTYNNPLALVDNNGKWPTGTHDKIIATAFNGLSPERIRQIQKGSASVDANFGKPARLLTENTLVESQAFKHAMTPGDLVRQFNGDVGRAQQEATRLMNDFIGTTLANAQRTYQAGENRNGVNNAALVTFGEAMHPVMDNGSPAHRGMQVYDLAPYLRTYQGYASFGLGPVGAVLALNDFRQDMDAHAAEEARPPTPEEMNTMVDQMRMSYLQTFGREEYERAVSREEREATERRLRRQNQ